MWKYLPLLLSTTAFAAELSPCRKAHQEHALGEPTAVFPQIPNKSEGQYEKLVFAKDMVKAVFDECTEKELGIDIHDRSKNRCSLVLPGDIFSNVCYLSGDLGYYIVHSSPTDIANVFYNPWD